MQDDEDFDFTPASGSLDATTRCECDPFQSDQACQHTLATTWWLQEQLARRGAAAVFEFLNDLKVDTVAAGREMVDELLSFAKETAKEVVAEDPTRLQWRIGMPNSRYYSPLSITAYEQKMRKNRKGWTKGREVRSYDLLRRDFSACTKDGRIAAMVAKPSYSFDEDHYNEFQALLTMVGHDNVAWDDTGATPVTIYSSELTLTLSPVTVTDKETAADDHTETAPPERGDATANSDAKAALRFQPCLQASGMKIDPHDCKVIMGHASPVDPVVILVDTKGHRVVICTLRDPKQRG